MTESRPWRRLWEGIDRALAGFDDSLAKGTGVFLKEVRTAVTEYGRDVDPGSFDEYGQPREEAET